MARIPLIPNLSTKDGEANQNARMTNALSEKNPTGTVFAAVRPGLRVAAEAIGNGRGIVEFNGNLLSVYGATLENAVIPSRIGYGEENVSKLNTGAGITRVFPNCSNSDLSYVGGFIIDTKYRAAIFELATKRWTLIGTLSQTYEYSVVDFISEDGQSAIGRSRNDSNVIVPFLWTATGGMVAISGASSIAAANSDLTVYCGIQSGTGFAFISDNGVVATFSAGTNTTPLLLSETKVVVGSYTDSGNSSIFRRDENGLITTYGTGHPHCITPDGSVFFGGTLGNLKPVRWTAGTGLVQLSASNIGSVVSCSDDGTVAVGGRSGTSFKWTLTSGIEQILGTDFGEFEYTFGDDIKVSSDGSTICGMIGSDIGSPANYSLFVWQPIYGKDTVIRINRGTSNTSFVPFGFVSDDGWYVIYPILENDNPTTEQTMLWTRDTGIFRTIATLEDQFFDFVQSTL